MVADMSGLQVVFFQDDRGRAPVVEWLRDLQRRDRKAYAKCVVKMKRLAELGHGLRRPEADYLRDGIYELRTARGHVNFRILYFFHGQSIAILAHALTKHDKVPDAEIDRAVRRKKAFETAPEAHSYEASVDHA